MSEESGLGICSVSFGGAPFLRLNARLTWGLNRGRGPREWVVVENTPQGMDGRLDEGDREFTVIPGVRRPEEVAEVNRGSHHHGAALNKAFASLSERFVLVLDPDFFIVRDGWIDEVLAHMARERLAFFGVPWHPRWYKKIRYFPCVHCLFIDRDRVDDVEIDFMPDLASNPPPFASDLWESHRRLLARGQWLQAWLKVLRRPRRALADELEQRRRIGSSRDTGFLLAERFAGRRSVRYESIEAVFPHPTTSEMIPPNVTRLQRSRLLEALLPDRLRYLPRRRRSFTRTGFGRLGYPDVAKVGWEEFVWNGSPFGFHIRSYLGGPLRGLVEHQDPDGILVQILEGLTGLTLATPAVGPGPEAGGAS